jgi:hypothetical protein
MIYSSTKLKGKIMLKKIGLSIIVLSALLLTGCGGGSSDINEGNNQNKYGYYGGTTKFGDYTATRYWVLINSNEVIVLLLTDKAIYALADETTVVSGEYGISGDAKTIKSDKLNDISILSTSEYTWQVDGQNVSCYNVSGGDRDIIMCPDKQYVGTYNKETFNQIQMKVYDSNIF